MRRCLVAVAVTLVLCGGASPASAVGPPGFRDLARSPSGGVRGTDITVTGLCDQPSGRVELQRVSYPANGFKPDVVTDFQTVNGQFTAHLTNIYGTEGVGAPSDVEVIAHCGTYSYDLRQPFHGSDLGRTASPSIFTTMGPGICGASNEGVLCPALTKGFNDGGAVGPVFTVASWAGGASIAAGDLDGDGVPEIVNGTPRGLLPVFNAFNSSTEREIGTFQFVYGMFTGGVNVAVGDVTGDGVPDVVTGAGAGGGPHVKVFTFDRGTHTFSERNGFYAYDPGFSGGVNVAVGDVNGDGRNEIITGAGPGGGPHVRVFDGNGQPLAGFYAYDPHFSGGVRVAAGNVLGTSAAEIVTGAGPGGGPHVEVFDGAGHLFSGFYAFDPSMSAGVTVAVAAKGRTQSRIVVGAGPGGGPLLCVFDPNGALQHAWYPYAINGGGVTVAAI